MLLLVFLIGLSLLAVTNAAACPGSITSSTTMTDNYVGGVGWACVEIAASDIIFDCNGYNITGDGNNVGVEVSFPNAVTNVTIKNCNVANYDYGFIIDNSFALGANNITLLNNTAHNNTYSGFRTDSSSNKILTNNSAYNNTLFGFWLNEINNSTLTNNSAYNNSIIGFLIDYNSSGNNMANNLAYNNPIGFLINHSSNNNALANNFAYNNEYGFYLNSSSNNILTNNTGYSNLNNSFFLDTSSNNALNNNSAYDNSESGFYLIYSSNNTLTNNIAHDNAVIGITLRMYDTNNTLINNSGYDNGYSGIEVHTNSINNTFINNTAYGNSLHGFDISTNASNNIFINNIAHDHSHFGFYIVDNSSNNYFVDNIAYNSALDGFILAYSCLNNTLTNNTAYDNTRYGFYIYSNSDNNILTNNTAYNNGWYGFYLANAFNNALTNNSAYNNPYGFLFYTSSNNTLNNNTAHDNTYGIYLDTAPNNILTSNLAYSNSQRGFYLTSGSNNNILTNNTAHDNTDAGFLLFGDNNILTRNTAYNNDFIGFYLDANSNNTLNSNTAHDNFEYGFYLTTGSSNNIFINNSAYSNTLSGFVVYLNTNNNVLINNTAYNNPESGLVIEANTNNTLTSNTAYNSKYGFVVNMTSTNNILINNTAYNNSFYGFFLNPNSNNNILTNNSAYNNSQYGLYIDRSSATNATNMHFFNNTISDFYITADATPRTVYLTNLTLDNPSGNMKNYTSISLTDTVDANTAYNINWSDFSGSLPANHSSFAQKYVNVSQTGGTVIDSISFLWTDAETSGYNQSRFGLWKNNGSWSNTGATLGANALTLTNMNPASTYGILENTTLTPTNCDSITTPTTTTLTDNCVSGGFTIDTSNFIFDCNGYNITGDGYGGIGIMLDSVTNVTIRNCNIENYSYGIFSYQSYNSRFINNTAYNNSEYGFYFKSDGAIEANSNNTFINNSVYNNSDGFVLSFSSNNTLTNNTAHNNLNTGFVLYYSSSNNLTSNLAYNNTGSENSSGFYFETSYNNILINNSAYDNSHYGFFLNISSNYYSISNTSSNNILINNTAYSNLNSGFYLATASNNTLNNNFANNNTRYGFYLTNSSDNNFTDINASSNGEDGIIIDITSNNNAFTNVNANNNGQYGIAAYGSSYNSIFTDCTADYNSLGGFYLHTSDNNIITNTNADYNGGNGIYIWGSSNNFTNVTANNNAEDGLAIGAGWHHFFTNVTANNNQYGFYDSPWADYGTFTNCTANNNTQHGFYIIIPNNNNLTGNTANNNQNGFYLHSWNNNLTGNTANNNSQYGFYLESSSEDSFTNNIADNNRYGFYLEHSWDNLLTGNTITKSSGQQGLFMDGDASSGFQNNVTGSNTINGLPVYYRSDVYGGCPGSVDSTGYSWVGIVNCPNVDITGTPSHSLEQLLLALSDNAKVNGVNVTDSRYGMYIFTSSNSNISGSAASNSQFGLFIVNSNATNATNTHLFNNTYDFYITSEVTPRTVYLNNVTLDNPAGNMENSTSISLADTVEANTAYKIYWSTFTGGLPTNHSSFAQKYVGINKAIGTVSIDSISFLWTDAEVTAGSYNKSKFELWKNNGTWSDTGATLGANALTLTNLNPASTYGILENSNAAPSHSDFDGNTTDFDHLIDLHHVSRPVLEKIVHGIVKWLGEDIDVHGANFDNYVLIGDGWLSINSIHLHPSMNSSANVSLYNLHFAKIPIVFNDGNICDDCVAVSYAGGVYTFQVSHFSNYSLGTNSRLFIFDDNDPEGGSKNKGPGENITFYANYSNVTSGAAITPGMGGACDINFSEAPTGPFPMTYNVTSLLWEYNRTFTALPVTWSVNCSSTDFESLNVTDVLNYYSQATMYGANITSSSSHPRWEGLNSSTPINTEGGNVSDLNLTSNTLTDRWAAFYGNISGDIYLTSNDSGTAQYVYMWAWTTLNGGEVCTSTNSSLLTFGASGATGADIDTAWSFPSATSDSGVNTFSGSGCAVKLGAANVTGASYADTGDPGGFETCAVKTTATPAKSEMLFCSFINDTGVAYNGDAANFEMMVPTVYGAGVYETYYFYASFD